MSLEAHVVPVTAILKVHMVENVIQLPASVAASRASQAERVMSVGHVMQLLMVSADVREKLFDAMLSVPDHDVRIC